jgi:hypothetical protein
MVSFYFWRLAQFLVQNGQHSNFQCRLILDESGGVADCVIDSKNRKSCKKCRFNKCLLAGMKATWVCSETKGNVSFLGNLGLKYYYRVGKNVDLTNVYYPGWKQHGLARKAKVKFNCIIIFGNLGKNIKNVNLTNVYWLEWKHSGFARKPRVIK